MTGLSDLPNEILLAIFNHVWPGDVENFAMVSKRHYLLSTKILERHRTRKLIYKDINDRYGHDIPSVLLSILVDPKLAWYIRQIVIDRARVFNEDWSQVRDSEDQPDSSDPDFGLDGLLEPSGPFNFTALHSTLLHSAMQDFFNGLGWKGWGFSAEGMAERIENGDDGFLKLFLTLLLPNLSSLVVTCHQPHNDRQETFVKYISSYLHESAISLVERPLGCFQNLRKVHLNHWTKKRHPSGIFGLSVRDCATFFTLPAIEELRTGVAAYPAIDELYRWEYAPRSSVLKDWDSGFTEFKSGELKSLLEGIRSLRSFRPASWQILPSLHTLFTHSLEVLHLEGAPENLELRELLKDFYVLKELSLSYIALLYHDSSTTLSVYQLQQLSRPADLSTILPRLLETLLVRLDLGRLRKTYSVNRALNKENPEAYAPLINGIADFVEMKSTSCPHLRGVCLSRVSDFAWSEIQTLDRLSTTCKVHDVVLSTPHKDIPECSVCQVYPKPVLGPGVDELKGHPTCFTRGR